MIIPKGKRGLSLFLPCCCKESWYIPYMNPVMNPDMNPDMNPAMNPGMNP
jgi:hypothetical protein